MRVLVAHNLILDCTLVPVPRLVLDVTIDQRVLGEDFAHQEFLGQSKRINVSLCNVNELCLRVVAKVVVTEERVAADLMSNLERHFVKRLLVCVEADSNCAVYDEVHLQDFLFLVVDHIFVLLVAEMTRLQSKGHVVEELTVLVLLGIEEEAEVVEYVVEEVVDDNASLNLAWQGIDELVVLLNLAEPIVEPVVLEVLVDLAIERVG